MQHVFPRIISLIAMTITSIAAMAFNISGRIVDSNNEAMPDATVRLLSARDSSYIGGTTANSKGFFRLSNVKSGKYILQCTFIGYDAATKDVTVAETDIRLRPIAMTESSILLKEITATGVKTQIKVKEDTIEFNADSYKTQPNAVVEDLLKRLPGVEVGSDGKITANGKEVKKILVDGKEFFSDDPKVATKNLPVDMVDKLQVVDRQSDLARLTGVDDGEEETVINLTVKKGMNNGWFGSAEVGYGTDDRYKSGFIVNRFWNGNQITVIGSANNINELGFTDGNSGRFRRFGGDNGITTSQTLGINFNVGKEEIFRVGGNVMYSHTDRNSRQTQNRQYLFADSTSYEESAKRANDAGHNIRADFRLKWEPDKYNTFEFKPRVSFNFNDSESLDSTLTLAGNYSPVNKSFNTGISDGNSFEFRGELVYNHKFRQRKG
ncbi:MAG: carboxypeptidase-like regulatory domain-containing protein, partial [Muribaculaceae bacterium]|nr:carboxypeptidase-like regulatory domain-containing protein [Muribaculaceae bacterium]